MSATISYQVENGLACIILNRPEKYNSFNYEMAMALQEALRKAAADTAVRCVYLSAQGKAFCAGQDLGESPDPSLLNFEQILEERYNPIVVQIRKMPKPVVCAVNGVAAGAGANLALAADIVLAKESAQFIQAFIHIGLIPDCGGTFMLPRLVGLARAMALCMTGEKVSAQEAVQMGMIYKAIPDEVFETQSKAFAQALAEKPTTALVYTKELINKSLDLDLEQQLMQEMRYQVASGNTQDYKEGVAAFLEKRKAQFIGK